VNLTTRLEKESGFRVERHQLEVYGTCPVCLITPGVMERSTLNHENSVHQ
jgi:hypothetical protein